MPRQKMRKEENDQKVKAGRKEMKITKQEIVAKRKCQNVRFA